MKEFSPIPLGMRMHTALSQSMPEMQEYRPRASTGITSCRRKLAYHALKFEPKTLSGRAALSFDDGHYTEEQTAEVLKLVPGVEIVAKQIPVPVPGFPKDGHADYIVNDNGAHILIEHKNFSMWKFDALEAGKEQPTDAIYQLAIYWHHLMRDEWHIDRAVLFVRNRNTGAYLEYWFSKAHGQIVCTHKFSTRIPEEPLTVDIEGLSFNQVIDDYWKMFGTVQQAVDSQTLPPRDYVFGIDWQCDYCAFSGHCISTIDDTMKKVAQASGETLETGRSLSRIRDSRLASEKEEKEFKKRLIMDMRDKSLEAVEIDGWVYVRSIAYTMSPDGEQVPAEKLVKSSKKTYLKNGGKEIE